MAEKVLIEGEVGERLFELIKTLAEKRYGEIHVEVTDHGNIKINAYDSQRPS